MKHHQLADKLKKRGWEEKHIAKTIHILKKADSKKHPKVVLLEKVIFWVVLFLSILINIAILIRIIPLFSLLHSWFAAAILIIIGLCFGFLVDNILRDLDHFSVHHFLAAGVVLPVIAGVSMIITVNFAKIQFARVGFIVSANPLFFALIYVASFSLPHLLYRIRER